MVVCTLELATIILELAKLIIICENSGIILQLFC